MKISEVLSKYETDKIWHHRYGDAYDQLFSRYDRNAPLNILEVGTQKGGSLLAWKEYFPNANVYGIDIVDGVLEKYRLDTVTRLIGDIKDLRTEIRFDIVIDDGSHYISDVIYVITTYFTTIKVGGMIIIEDVRNYKLIRAIFEEMIKDLWLGFPNYSEKCAFEGKIYDNRIIGGEESFLLAMIKNGI